MSQPDRSRQHGQVIALFALALAALVVGVAVVVDGGYAYAQRRATQNAADFAAMAATRVVGVSLTGNPAGQGTATNVRNAVTETLAANDATLVDAKYVNEGGLALGAVMSTSKIPDDAFGVAVEARTNWQPFLLGVIGIADWASSASATAKTPGESRGGGVIPLGVRDTTFDSLTVCDAGDLNACIDNLTSGQLNIPGGFGWLTFGLNGNGGKCQIGPSLGMIDEGCNSSKTSLDDQIKGDTAGCCGPVGQPPGSTDLIWSNTGNAWGDLSDYINKQIPVWVPIWNWTEGNGFATGKYHIVGFGALYLTGDNEHAKWIEGAAVDVKCSTDPTHPLYIEDHSYCKGPGGSFKFDVTGEVQLVR